MRFAIKEHFWSWGNDFSINDPDGNPVYRIDGAAFSWGDNLSFQDAHGNELARIEQKMFSFKPRYHIYRNGQFFAEVTKEWSWFNKQFSLDVPGPNDYTIKGKFWVHEYDFFRGGEVVASVSKEFFRLTDTYGVDVQESEDEVTILATVIVIDQVLHDGNN